MRILNLKELEYSDTIKYWDDKKEVYLKCAHPDCNRTFEDCSFLQGYFFCCRCHFDLIIDGNYKLEAKGSRCGDCIYKL